MFDESVAEVMDLSDEALTQRFRELELQRRRAESEMATLVREGDRRAIQNIDGHRNIRQWVRAQINCSGTEASRLRKLGVASDIVPGLGDALSEGHIGVAQAHEIARLSTHPGVGDQFGDVAPLLLDHAEHLSFEEFRVVTRRWETLADLDGAERNDEMSHERRTASAHAGVDGVAVGARGGTGMTAAEMDAIFQRFVQAEFEADVAARTATFGPDAPASRLPRTDAQRRFDALVAIFRVAIVAPADGVAPRPVVNLLVGLGTYERITARHVAGDDSGIGADVDLSVERMESDTGVAVTPADVIAASIIGHVRRVVVDAAGVVVDAGRKRRLFTGTAREMALLLAHGCGHLGCTVRAGHCDVDHVAEWERDHGHTNQSNGKPRCGSHNPYKSANGIRTARTRHGTTVDIRADGTPMAPVGRRIELDDIGPPDVKVAEHHGYRFARVDFCRLHLSEARIELRSAICPDDQQG